MLLFKYLVRVNLNDIKPSTRFILFNSDIDSFPRLFTLPGPLDFDVILTHIRIIIIKGFTG